MWNINGVLSTPNPNTQPLTSIFDDLSGDSSDETLIGFKSDDVITSGGGIDRLFGKDGDDKLYSIDGGDFLDGGEDRNTFYISSTDTNGEVTIAESFWWNRYNRLVLQDDNGCTAEISMRNLKRSFWYRSSRCTRGEDFTVQVDGAGPWTIYGPNGDVCRSGTIATC